MNAARVVALLIIAVGSGSAGCGDSSGTPSRAPDPFNAPAACTSGTMRDTNETEGDLMMPGHACNACHEEENAATGEGAPVFRFAGTIYPSGHEPDGCVGSHAHLAEVRVRDAAGFVFAAPANASGNFMLETTHALISPYSAEVHFQGRVRPMLTPQTSGDCNACHTQDGTMGAPGRVALP